MVCFKKELPSSLDRLFGMFANHLQAAEVRVAHGAPKHQRIAEPPHARPNLPANLQRKDGLGTGLNT